MTDQAAERLASAFVQGCDLVAQSIAAVAVALRPEMAEGGCPHPPDQRDYSGATMGNLWWICRVCGHDSRKAA